MLSQQTMRYFTKKIKQHHLACLLWFPVLFSKHWDQNTFNTDTNALPNTRTRITEHKSHVRRVITPHIKRYYLHWTNNVLFIHTLRSSIVKCRCFRPLCYGHLKRLTHRTNCDERALKTRGGHNSSASALTERPSINLGHVRLRPVNSE